MEITTYLNRVHIGNALELAEALPAESIHCIVTSPPYLGLRDYGLPPFDWQAVEYAPMPGLPPVRVEAWRGCLGLEPDPFMYVGHLVAIFRALRRVLRSDGVLWLNLGDSYATSGKQSPGEHKGLAKFTENYDGVKRNPENWATMNGVKTSTFRSLSDGLKPKDLMAIPWRAALALQADGWWLRSDVIWHKPNPMPESVTDRPTKAHEYLFLLAKSERYFYDAEAVREANAPETQAYFEKYESKYEDGYTKRGLERNPLSGPQSHLHRKGGRNAVTANLNPAGRNRRSVWTVDQPAMKLRDDLTQEQRDYVVSELLRRKLL